jgi:hypothetical protein
MNLENNKLIAEFLGYTQPHPEYKSATYWYKKNESPLTILSFDTDWNWLMRAIEKILDISLDMDSMEMYYNITDCVPNIEQSYLSVVEFIKLYNKN